MDFKRIGLLFATAVVGVLLWVKWTDYSAQHNPSVSKTPPTHVSSSSSKKAGQSPQSKSVKNKTVPHSKSNQKATPAQQMIHVKTDTFDMTIDPAGARIVSVKLVKYHESTTDSTPISILTSKNPGSDYYVMDNQLVTSVAHQPLNINYTLDSTDKVLSLSPGENQLVLTLHGKQNGVVVTKKLTFSRNSYAVKVNTSIKNNGKKDWQGALLYSIVRTKPAKSVMASFNGASYSSAKEDYEKLSYSNMDDKNLNQQTNGGWVAMQQHYFLSAWVPKTTATHTLMTSTKMAGAKRYQIGSMIPLLIAKQTTEQQSAIFYVGPENTHVLAGIAKNLDLTVNYGWFSAISKFLFFILKSIYSVVGNWGWSIILITVFIKIVLYYPSAKSYRSMARMKEVAPKMKILQERHKDDKQKLQQEMMALYRKEKVNPLGGCLPMLVQIPIFIALYHLLGAAVELRQAPFIGWIHDLSVKDPYYILPLLMGASMFAQQKLSPPPGDPTQAKVMMLLPVIFTVVFLHFSAGLVLYWLTNNILSIAQQTYIMRTFDPKEDERKQRYKKKLKRKRKSAF
jgi:YidC/Oxa1 family membrane protein insertase